MKNSIRILVLSLFVASCGSDPQTRSAGEGAGVGAVAGAAICAFAHCDRGQYAAAIAAGAAVGAGIGYTLAANIEKRRQQLADKENDLDARLEYVRGLNQDTEQFNRKVREQVAQMQNQIEERRASQR